MKYKKLVYILSKMIEKYKICKNETKTKSCVSLQKHKNYNEKYIKI